MSITQMSKLRLRRARSPQHEQACLPTQDKVLFPIAPPDSEQTGIQAEGYTETGAGWATALGSCVREQSKTGLGPAHWGCGGWGLRYVCALLQSKIQL